MRPTSRGAVIRIRGEHLVSVFSAAARRQGFVLRPAPTRYFAASSREADSDLGRLREALTKIDGVDELLAGMDRGTAAVRVTGVASSGQVVAAGKEVGFTLRQVGSYVAAGPSMEEDLARLRRALSAVTGVEQLQAQGLKGGATLLVYGDVRDEGLAEAARGAGFALWPLANAPGPTRFGLGREPGAEGARRLREVLQAVEGIGEFQLSSDAEGPCLIVCPGRARPEAILAAGREAGFTLSRVESISLPSLEPAAGRNTPPDFEERVVGELAQAGEPAPDFTLLGKDGRERITLSQFRGKRPVVLMFGSCT